MQEQICISARVPLLTCYILPILLSSKSTQGAVPPGMFSSLSTQAQKLLETEFSLPKADVGWEFPREVAHGDLSTNVALRVAKQLQKKPRDVAEALAKGLQEHADVTRAEVAGAGYVNLWLTSEALIAAVTEASKSVKPAKKRAKEDPVIVEYSQPNIAKPLGIHHILSTVIGQAVSNLYEHEGSAVIRWNYMGDWGTQFGKLAVAMEKWGTKKAEDCTLDDLLDLYVRFHTEAEKDASLEEEARAKFRKLEEGDKALRGFWTDVITVTKASLQSVYERLHVRFDLDLSESFYEDKMDAVIGEGKKKGVFTEGERGALIVQFPGEKYPPYLIVKSDGATLYSTRDLTQMRYRIDTYHPKSILIFTDVAQKLHFEQLEETCKMLGWELPHFENVLFGRMRFADASMSTRKGNILRLQEVLDEAVSRADNIITERGDAIQTDDSKDLAEMMGTGALVYGILSQNRKMDLVFDWNKMLSFEGNSAPYLQYTHARAKSVLRKAKAPKQKKETVAFPENIGEIGDAERQLLKTLLQFPDALTQARTTHMPHKLANFLYQLCQDFNAFYTVSPIMQAEEPVRSFRLALVNLAASVLRTGAELLTLRLPERM